MSAKQLKFGTGGSTGVTYGGQSQINKQRTRFGSKFGYKLNAPDESLNKYVGMKDGGDVKELRKGGSTNPKLQAINKQKTNHGSMQLPNAMLNKHVGLKSGGMMKHEDTKLDKKIVKKAVGMHDKQLHGGKKTNLTKLARGGGIETKGKTKGTMIKMAAGGLAMGHKSADGIATKGKTKGKEVAMCGGGMSKGKK